MMILLVFSFMSDINIVSTRIKLDTYLVKVPWILVNKKKLGSKLDNSDSLMAG